MPGGEVVEGKQLVQIFDQTLGGFGVLGGVLVHEELGCSLGVFAPLCHPDLVEGILGPLVESLGKLVEDVVGDHGNLPGRPGF